MTLPLEGRRLKYEKTLSDFFADNTEAGKFQYDGILMMYFLFGKFVCFEFLVLWRVRIVKSPLLQWNIFADKSNQPAILLIKILNNRK